MINFIKIAPSFTHPYLFMYEYMYIDTDDYQIDDILAKTNIGFIAFNKMEGSHENHPGFKVCFVKCFKAKDEEMKAALRKLDWALTVKCGKKYTDFRDELFSKLN